MVLAVHFPRNKWNINDTKKWIITNDYHPSAPPIVTPNWFIYKISTPKEKENYKVRRLDNDIVIVG
jgi:hypothetical protein